jgi:hypothetical protein
MRDSTFGLACALLLAAANLAPASWSAPAQAPAAPVEAVLACRSVTDPVARLACFDRTSDALATPLAGAPAAGAPTAGPPAAASPPDLPAAAPDVAPPGAVAAPSHVAPLPPLDAQQEFGKHPRDVAAAEVAAGIRAPDVNKIQAAIVAIGFAANGRMLFTLDNGQVWRQLVREGELLAKVGDPVTISRGLFGSFWLQAASGRGCKVSRVD